MLPARIARKWFKFPCSGVLLLVSASLAWAVGAPGLNEAKAMENPAAAASREGNGEQLEKDLQGLSWDQFKLVLDAIPKLKADVDAYGPLGWQYVQSNYRTYPWRRNINKLQEPQRKRLAELIDEVRSGGKSAN